MKKDDKPRIGTKRILRLAVISAAAAVTFVLLSNLIIMLCFRSSIVTEEKAVAADAECILILGAGVWEGGRPSPMLKDRLDEGLRLYEQKAAPKILVSGDHGREDYDEVNVMKTYLTDAGVPADDIFMDHAGFSTYDSLVRAKEVFGAENVIVVTQKYHMYRALYIARSVGIRACGVHADPRPYAGALYRNLREAAARDKDIFCCLFRIPPKYLGDRIDLSGDGSVTDG